MRLIDADSLIEDCQKYLKSLNPDKDTREYARIKWLIGVLNNVPTIEPERKKGKWIDCDGSEHWKCDKCGCRAGYWFNEENSSSWELDMSEWLSNFCPNCGAEMSTEDKE